MEKKEGYTTIGIPIYIKDRLEKHKDPKESWAEYFHAIADIIDREALRYQVAIR